MTGGWGGRELKPCWCVLDVVVFGHTVCRIRQRVTWDIGACPGAECLRQHFTPPEPKP